MDTTTPKPFVFVMMPFAVEFNDVYQLGIKPACDAAGAYAERLDEQIFTDNMLDRIYNQISKADAIVADMTGRNPNVFYETRYAHALGKKVILLTQKSEDIPFDLKHYPHIVYAGNITDLKGELEKRVRWALEQSKATFYKSTQFFVDGQSLLNQSTIQRSVDGKFVSAFGVRIDIHNSIEKQLRVSSFRIGIILDDEHIDILREGFKEFRQPDNRMLFFMNKEFRLNPGSWDYIVPTFNRKDGGSFKKDDSFSVTLRLFYEDDVMDFPCQIIIT
ncbi:MAG: hypothetical protein ACLQPD_18305 [Desulfomonilaceae bacterium]